MVESKKQIPMLSHGYLVTKIVEIIDKQIDSNVCTENKHQINKIQHQKNLRIFFHKVKKIKKIWKKRGKNYENTSVKYPKTVYFQSVNEYYSDTNKYNNVLIEFPLGGEVGDREWNIQFMHNSSVLSQYHSKRFPSPPKILFHYVVVPKYSEKIEIYVNNILLNRNRCDELQIRDELLEVIKPDISSELELPTDHKVYFIDTFGFDDYCKDGNTMKCLCDGVETSIHFIRKYDVEDINK